MESSPWQPDCQSVWKPNDKLSLKKYKYKLYSCYKWYVVVIYRFYV